MARNSIEIEEALCSKLQFRILKLLMEIECLTPTQIANKLRTSYVATRTHLKTLENNDVLTHVRFGKRICHYRFKENARANAVRQLIETWKDYENQT